jgi:hypothetical protein
MSTRDLNSADAGGIHIAPALGTRAGAEALYQIQWMELIRGYFLEIVLALGFAGLAAMACSLIPLTGRKPAQLWLAVALLSVALMRANQALFFWGQIETVQGFELVTNVLLVPLMLGAWTIAWSVWLNLESCRWIVPAAAVLTVLHVALQCLGASWFLSVFSPGIESALGACVAGVRLLFVVLTLYILFRVATRPGYQKGLALAAIVLISIGLFAQELSRVGVPAIWFPFGTGVSRTQFAYAAFDIVFFALTLQRLSAVRNERCR